jgi:hypothetical protein
MNLKTYSLNCALFTISPQGSFYRNVNPFKMVNTDIVLIGNTEKLSFYLELNKVSTRDAAKILLRPFLQREQKIGVDNKQKRFKSPTVISYLKKYKRNYYGFFYKNFTYYQTPPNDKTLNTIAIENLFMLAGL